MDRRRFLSVGILGPAALVTGAAPAAARAGRRGFGFTADGSGFLLDGAPFQIRSGEMHPARIPVEYWRHRIRTARAMGLNTIALYVMWNQLEESPGVFDLRTDRRDLEGFIDLCRQEEMRVLLRPGPYVCGEWDLGGLPPYLLRDPDIRLRVGSADDPRYLAAVARYVAALAPRIGPLLASNGGPVLMVQLENEYASVGSGSGYLEELRRLWLDHGVDGPFYTEDVLAQAESARTVVGGGAIGLSGGDAAAIAAARRAFPGVPALAGEVYPGWLTHWGDDTFQGRGNDISAALRGCMEQGLSFNIYMVHGGTNFGFTAGANADDLGGGYRADITSYDYGAPITEQGVPTARYAAYRAVIAAHLAVPPPQPPAAVPTLTGDDVPALLPEPYASLWDNLPGPLPAEPGAAPRPMEAYGQNTGFVLYSRRLPGLRGGRLAAERVHDYATVCLDGRYLGTFARQSLPAAVTDALGIATDGPPPTLDLGPAGGTATGAPGPRLDMLVEGMGRTNTGLALADRKGLLGPVTLRDAGPLTGELTDWRTTLLPMDEPFVASLVPGVGDPRRPGIFFRTTFELTRLGDTYLDLSGWTKGVVWVNGRNLGRYWQIGPQQRLYCPAPWLRAGTNELLLFDLHQLRPRPVTLHAALTDAP
ncbi:beta-galactosidase [Kitasatospora sp. MBT63]|uniref:beta-galactosidase n=1 Tax=Kitasatospora sp. MBT63 TaxID=1444768 RepID=UPI0009E89EA5|nr:beta-galactosidase [Kitasatospora sp. MBT63]